MRTFKVVNKTYVKSSNSIKNIYLKYTYSLILFIILTIVSYLLFGYHELVIPLLKSLGLSLLITSIIGYIINLINKETNIIKIYTKDNLHLIAIIFGLFGTNLNILVLTMAITISLILKKVIKNIELSAILYGLLIILLYRNFNSNLIIPLTKLSYSNIVILPVKDYLIGTIYLSPILSVLAFVYLFYEKSIKYNIYISYILTFSFIIFIYSILSNCLWFTWYSLLTHNILFLAVYALPDYKATPTIKETSIIYGIILGVLSAILKFIVPELSIVIVMILGMILLTNLLENLSAKLKYNRRLYNTIIIVSIILIITIAIVLTFIF